MAIIEELTSKYLGALTRTEVSTYADSNSEYKCFLDSYETLMNSINTSPLETIKSNKRIFEKECKDVQKKLKKAWEKVFPDKEYPEQDSIPGIHIIACEIIEEIKNSRSRKAITE